MHPKITIGMIVLNEEEYIWHNLKQHYDFAHQIVVVEGSVLKYPNSNVLPNGRSTDKTAEIVKNFPDPKNKIEFIQPTRRWKDKVEQRNQYLQRATGDFLIVIDADEFYTKADQQLLNREFATHRNVLLFKFERAVKNASHRRGIIHFWYGFKHQVIGGYWDIPHNRIYRQVSGMKYVDSHNHPTYLNGVRSDRLSGRFVAQTKAKCYHAGFVKKLVNIRDKNRLYLNRGEGREPQPNIRKLRQMYIDCRTAWETWKPGISLPHGAKIVPYAGHIPEALLKHPYHKKGFSNG